VSSVTHNNNCAVEVEQHSSTGVHSHSAPKYTYTVG